MLYNILTIGKSGLNATQSKLDVTAGNLANVDTVGYKKKNIAFQELLINNINDEEVILSENTSNLGINAGTKSGIGTIDYKQGTLYSTSNIFDMAIEGNGFFGLKDENENLLLTRNGQFHMNEDKSISDANGYLLDIDYIEDLDKWDNNVTISKIGEVNKVDENNNIVLLGRIKMYYPQVLHQNIPIDSNAYILANGINLYNSIDNPEHFGNILQNMLERSNVELSESMVDMIVAQRSYAMNARVVSTTNDVLGIVNNIKR